jgi:hypothetical protein
MTMGSALTAFSPLVCRFICNAGSGHDAWYGHASLPDGDKVVAFGRLPAIGSAR